jgi:hypothetical protein
MQPPERLTNGANHADFYRSMRRSLDRTSTTGQPAGNSSPAPQVVASPFNVLGLPVSTTPAPTAAEVAANPEKYAGTSFDPARHIRWPWMQSSQTPAEEFAPPGYGLGYGWTPQMYAAHFNPSVPPPGSVATSNPNVYTMPSGATWILPGSAPQG